MKKMLYMCLVLMLMVAIFPLSASALTEGDWEYKILENEVVITKYLGSDEHLVVPSSIRGCPVVAIETIEKGNLIKSISFPETLREIREFAFYNFRKMEKINFPASLEKIGACAFKGCESLESIDLSHCAALTQLDEGVFSECKALKNIALPDNFTTYPDFFLSKTAIENFTISKKITSIGEFCFQKTPLETIIIPGSVRNIDEGAFRDSSVKLMILSPGVETIAKDDSYLGGVFAHCEEMESIFIPSSVSCIGKSAFYECENLIVYCAKNSYAESFCKQNEISYIIDNSVDSSIHVLYNNRRVSFHSYGQNPEIVNGRTLVPLRSIFEVMGASVSWDANTETAIAVRGKDTISVKIGDSNIYKNGVAIPTDVPAQLMNSRTMIPARVIAEAFGATVSWDENTNAVHISE